MAIFYQVGKVITLCFWLAVIASLFAVFPDTISRLLGWAAVAIIVLHTIEVLMFATLIAKTSTEPKFDKMMVLVFGVFHILPALLKEQQRMKS